ncbi:DUF6879 family protein [Streptomyces radicis]|uniref:DUF6879 domain-containing protein n=1 Tax=Streptomyces radicis TaxID=1750517 RepID=A0A3A9VWM8_9ACTN|nr:DUF6879 family protein [Streptomyces radicis]RKN05401.1 hypothetical protein D7319_25685 [Streptomyces radicis]RKN16909.1 hypothetical protein D7318_25050 [Streptomyces radicis]
MLDVHTLRLDPAQGTHLPLDAYTQDFAERESATRDHVSWKFERNQHFEEQGDPSRDALSQGRWDEALRLLEGEREHWLGIAREDEKRGTPFRRVRVVETPLTPYMQWELHALRVQAEAGLGIRVVEAERIRAWEESGLLPEVVVLGGQVLYEVLYTDAGVLAGGRRFTEQGLIRHWEQAIESLYASGEDVVSYVDRYVSRLPSPFPGQGVG